MSEVGGPIRLVHAEHMRQTHVLPDIWNQVPEFRAALAEVLDVLFHLLLDAIFRVRHLLPLLKKSLSFLKEALITAQVKLQTWRIFPNPTRIKMIFLSSKIQPLSKAS